MSYWKGLYSAKTARQPTERETVRQDDDDKPEAMIAIALSDMEQLIKSSRSGRVTSRPIRAPGCQCSCHLLNDVTISPRQAVFTPQGGISTHNLSNTSKTPLAVKITCSDNALYRVSPVFAILEPGRCIPLNIGRLEGPVKKDRLCILLVEYDGKTSAKDTFKRTELHPTNICVPLLVADE
ncbi:unnamed protein product [Auanema sp. JU1783]|nr:unnamed protein product [Auanema sp. JU1783]